MAIWTNTTNGIIHNMSHTHLWRTTSRTFALVCECGEIYHEWARDEIDRLRAEAAAPASAEVAVLRAQLEDAHRETATLRADLDIAKRALEAHAAKVPSQIAEPPKQETPS